MTTEHVSGKINTEEGVTYTPWTNGYAVGFMARHEDGRIEYVYLNPSSDDTDGQPNVFVYHGTAGDPSEDQPVVFVTIFPTETVTIFPTEREGTP